LLGIELAENISKVANPLIVTGTGLTIFATSKNQHLKYKVMAKSQDSKKNVKTEPAKTAKEKKAEKREKKAKKA
jgi:hypothetical protein